MPERNRSQPDPSTNESPTDSALSDADALRAALGAFLYRVASDSETELPEETEALIGPRCGRSDAAALPGRRPDPWEPYHCEAPLAP